MLRDGEDRRTDLDVESGDTDFLALGGNILGSQHGGVRLQHAHAHAHGSKQ